MINMAFKFIFKGFPHKFWFAAGAAVIVAAIAFFVTIPTLKSLLAESEPPSPPPTVINEMTDEEKEELLKHKSAEIQAAVVGESRERRELLVLERDVSVDSVWEDAWGGLDIFKKTKRIVWSGTGYYDIDLGGVTADSVSVDHYARTVTIRVPPAYLKSVSIDEGKTRYESTEKEGLLGFGELKLTPEQQGVLREAAEVKMLEELDSPEALAEADIAGKTAVEEIFGPVVASVAIGYSVSAEVG